ncbi:arginine utilization regulatory protein [Dethiosulfatibacter aminovorans DSM 17477]|uniref:Arginine utilization regulatory protein n=2 Tax=Dethiosulfatibacter TaxID=448125 RepID=A0A1M6E5I4_9FIRM|nr:arginine utilization regulatory protein [Dethiosulfatibacter aminovorans DSM 17477]
MAFSKKIKKSKPILVVLNEENIIKRASKGFDRIIGKKSFINERFEDFIDIDFENFLGTNEVIDIRKKKYFVSVFNLEKDDYREKFILLFDISFVYEMDKKIYCYEEIFNKLNDGIIISDEDGRILLYNKAQETLEGLTRSENEGKFIWEVYNYHSPENSEHRQVFKTGVPIVNEYKSHIRGKNVEKYVAYSTYPIVREGETIAVFSISGNESEMLNLLSETIELKRKLKRNKEIEYSDNGTVYNFDDIKGISIIINKTVREAEQLALLKGNLLLIGETGVGKEMFAQSIHNISNRNEKFFAINCAALPENLLESTLFGTTKGSFTGSVDQEGYFEAVGEGTLFLDELNSMPVYMQTKLLRVLQEKKFRKVGATHTKNLKCRIICAINEEPEKLVRENKLREDLFYRISRLCLVIPPLRERKEDIVYLLNYFISKHSDILDKNIVGMTNELKELLFEYQWPGNVRELEHVVENLVISASSEQTVLDSDNLPRFLRNKILKDKDIDNKTVNSLPQTLNEIERKLIVESLNKFNWNITKSAKHLGIIRQSLIYRMKKLDITKESDLWI